MRRDFDVKLAELLLIRGEYLLHQGRESIGDSRRAAELLQRKSNKRGALCVRFCLGVLLLVAGLSDPNPLG
jgi:hypothetical protein